MISIEIVRAVVTFPTQIGTHSGKPRSGSLKSRDKSRFSYFYRVHLDIQEKQV